MKIACFQLQGKEYAETYHEWVDEDSIRVQVENALQFIRENDIDVSVFPEMCFLPSYEREYMELSRGRLIVAGSYYRNGCNETVVFHHGLKHLLPKMFPSPHEPMFGSENRKQYKAMEVVREWEEMYEKGHQPDYFFKLPNGKFGVVLNCLDYYSLGNFVARSEILKKDLFLLLSPCSNNNVQLFIEESQVIHNHNSGIYSLIVNVDAHLNEKSYAVGESYVFGSVDFATHRIQKDLGVNIKHPASIVHAGKGSKVLFLEINDSIIPVFKRSDEYQKNPKLIQVENLKERKSENHVEETA